MPPQLPKAWGVLYAPPNPDGTPKACVNCFLWVSGESRCVIHERHVEVPASAVCGYHVFGFPMQRWINIPGLAPVDPALSGLEDTGDGTICGTCRFYKPLADGNGLCRAVAAADGHPPQEVQEYGCCARWERF